MALPPNTANSTCDVYRSTNSPPSPPDVANVSCALRPAFSEGGAASYTHLMLVAADVDVRDAYVGDGSYVEQDTVYVPSGATAVGYLVRFVERVGRGTAQDHKRVYLDRLAPTWPTDDL